MPDSPAAEIAIDAGLVRRLLTEQAGSTVPGAATLTLARAAMGWDCELWRLGHDLAVRLPRRALAAPLIEHEHATLPTLAALVAASRIGVPLPVFRGVPGAGYPWPWSVVPWFDGTSALEQPRADRAAWAHRLGEALGLLHVPASADHPANPYRGVPLRARDDTVRERIGALRDRGGAPELDAAEHLWRAAVAAPPHEGPPVWIHGDLHPGNLVVRNDELRAIIDFGDVTAGDPAYDLAIAWIAFDAAGRDRFRSALDGRYDERTWIRARGWAIAIGVLLLHQSDDDAAYAALGADTLAEAVG